jgi:hypothetical protein
LEQPSVRDESSVTVNGKLTEDVKVAPNSNQVKSLQAGAYADGGGPYLIVRETGEDSKKDAYT